MKNLSLILIGVLALAVGILFYQVNSLKNSGSNPHDIDVSSSDTIKTRPTINEVGPTNLAEAKIAFLNIDSINSQYLYIADESKKMKGKVQHIEGQIESLTASLQTEYESYQQSAQTGIAPQSELQKMEESLKRKDQEIKNKQLQLQNFQYDQQEMILALNEKLQQVVDKYNNGRFDYVISYSETLPILVFKNKKLDISGDIISILNEEYKTVKNKK
ncbi:MAG: OmpH family outer membrane protein [Bacteroidota bacterium]